MSGLDQSRKLAPLNGMFGLTRLADFVRSRRHVRLVPRFRVFSPEERKWYGTGVDTEDRKRAESLSRQAGQAGYKYKL